VVQPAAVQLEANLVFENLIGLLEGVEPVKINLALGALSTALQGRGDDAGAYLTDLNAYLREFNTRLPALRADLDAAPEVINAYADAAPDFVRIIDNFTTTGNTLTEQQVELAEFLARLTQFGHRTAGFLEDNRNPLVTALDVLRPTTASLERYSSIFPCFFERVNHQRKVQEPSFGGVVPGLRTLTSFQPGIGAYEYPANLPKLGVDEPSCFGGLVEGATVPRHVTFDDGSPDLQTRDRPVTVRPPSLATMLFGSAAEVIDE
jgi:phospholipid/cholesterol/gamma-HCH transport system substrate-binding protein